MAYCDGTQSPSDNEDAGETAATDCHGERLESDPELEGLTLYEKKALIIRREINAQGMGRYQCMAFFLCGFGYMLDLSWAQAFGLIASPLQQELGFPDTQLGNIFTAFSAGLSAGAIVWGIFADIVGRRWAFNFTVLISGVFGISLAIPSSYIAILILTAFVGFGIGGNIPIDTTICLEFLPQKHRWLLPTLSVFQPIGVVVCSGIAYGFIPNYSCDVNLPACNTGVTPCCTKASNYGWRYLLLTLGCTTLLIFLLRFAIFRLQESPKFLLYRGRDEEIVKVLQHIAAYNKCECHITLLTFEGLSAEDALTSPASSSVSLLRPETARTKATIKQQISLECQRYRLLFADSAVARLTIAIWIIYAFYFWGFTIAGSFLPTILLRKGISLGLSLQATYRSYVYIYIFGIPGVVLGSALYNGRQVVMFVSSALFGACLFLFTTVHSRASYVGVSGLVYFFQSTFNAVLYGWTPEAFPAPIRGTACGIASFWGRLFSIISPFIAAHFLEKSLSAVLYLAGMGVFVCTFTILAIPRKYL